MKQLTTAQLYIIMKNSEVAEAMSLISDIEHEGYEACIAGGAVRDICVWLISGCEGEPSIHDVDIATSMPIDQLSENDKFSTCSNNGEAHGTILVKHGGHVYEVTQYRIDGEYTDGRHPDSIEYASSFREDASRRDFTINAMGLSSHGEILDYFGGYDDLKKNVIRTVGSAVSRFSEDTLRIVRAARFAARFSASIDEDTIAGARCALVKYKDNASKYFPSMERIYSESEKVSRLGIGAMYLFMDYINKMHASHMFGLNPQSMSNVMHFLELTKQQCDSIDGDYSDYFEPLITSDYFPMLMMCLAIPCDANEFCIKMRMPNHLKRLVSFVVGSIRHRPSTYYEMITKYVNCLDIDEKSGISPSVLLDFVCVIVSGMPYCTKEQRNAIQMLSTRMPDLEDLFRQASVNTAVGEERLAKFKNLVEQDLRRMAKYLGIRTQLNGVTSVQPFMARMSTYLNTKG